MKGRKAALRASLISSGPTSSLTKPAISTSLLMLSTSVHRFSADEGACLTLKR